MPAPLGKTPRNRNFLVRMTEAEDTFVRAEAVRLGKGLNDVITGYIQDRMPAPEQPRAAPPGPGPATGPERPAKRSPRRGKPSARRGAQGSVEITWSDEPIPGQTAITDDDQ